MSRDEWTNVRNFSYCKRVQGVAREERSEGSANVMGADWPRQVMHVGSTTVGESQKCVARGEEAARVNHQKTTKKNMPLTCSMKGV